STRTRFLFFFFSSRRRHTRFSRDWSSDVCSSDLEFVAGHDEISLVAGSPMASGNQTVGVRNTRRKTGHTRSGAPAPTGQGLEDRSEERRVGKEGRGGRAP